MKKWIFVVIGYMILIVMLLISYRGKCTMEDNWEVATANVKAYDHLLSSTKDKNVAYQLTIDQLNSVNDSALKELNNLRKQLKVKDGSLKSMQSITATLEKVDTIILKDTVFKEQMVLDTLLHDDWYRAKLRLCYPDTIILSPSFRSEKSIIVSTKKETVNTPKRWWLLRLFQKKHKVLHVDVIESNPYVLKGESRYIEILK